MQLRELLYGTNIIARQGPSEVDVRTITLDSRAVESGSVFFAIRGTRVNGEDYIEKAVAAGASVVVTENLPAELSDGVAYIQVKDAPEAMGVMAANFQGNPTQDMQVVGITGTNGKTSVATLLYKLFRKLGYPVGLLSTVQILIDDLAIEATHTTPDALQLQARLAQMRDAGCAYVFMEVSSHAAHQKRIAGIDFRGAVFTNLTHDHLDYHGTFANYRDAKKLFFDGLSSQAFALVNLDDKNGRVMVQNCAAQKYGYGLQNMAEYRARLLEQTKEGMQMELGGQLVYLPFVGKFNAYNLLATFAVADLLEQNPEEVLTAMSALTPPEGRLQQMQSPGGVLGVVDYAHTPDALQNVLLTLSELRDGGQIITVVGAGGDRDKNKRPEMGRIAAELSERVVLTSDNPRSESPEAILDGIYAGVRPQHQKRVLRIANRREAIRTAVQLAAPGDIVLVAGKGHETYQEVNGQRAHFDDREELFNAFQELTA